MAPTQPTARAVPADVGATTANPGRGADEPVAMPGDVRGARLGSRVVDDHEGAECPTGVLASSADHAVPVAVLLGEDGRKLGDGVRVELGRTAEVGLDAGRLAEGGDEQQAEQDEGDREAFHGEGPPGAAAARMRRRTASAGSDSTAAADARSPGSTGAPRISTL